MTVPSGVYADPVMRGTVAKRLRRQAPNRAVYRRLKRAYRARRKRSKP